MLCEIGWRVYLFFKAISSLTVTQEFLSTNERRLIPGESIHWWGMTAAGRWQWWVRQSWRMRDQERRQEWGRIPKLSSPGAVSGELVASALFLLLRMFSRVGGGRRDIRDLGQQEKGSRGYMPASFDQIPIFWKGNISSRAVLGKETFHKLLTHVLFFPPAKMFHFGQSVEKLA